jgi:hypothetical protein
MKINLPQASKDMDATDMITALETEPQLRTKNEGP